MVTPGRDVDFGGPANYRIVVQGALSADWSERLANLAITTTRPEGHAPTPRWSARSATRPS